MADLRALAERPEAWSLLAVTGATLLASIVPTSIFSIDLDFDATLETRAIGLRLESDWALPAPLPGQGRRVALKDVHLLPDDPMTGPLASWLTNDDVALLRIRPPSGEASTSARLQSLVLPAGAYLRIELSAGNRMTVKPCGVFDGEIQLRGSVRLTEDGPAGARDEVLDLTLIEAVGFSQSTAADAGCPDRRATIDVDRPADAETVLGALRFGSFSLDTSDEARRSALVGGELEVSRTGERIALVPGDELHLGEVQGAIRAWHVDGERGVIVARVTGRSDAITVTTTSATAERGTRSATPSLLRFLLTIPFCAMVIGWIGIGSLSNVFRGLGTILAESRERR